MNNSRLTGLDLNINNDLRKLANNFFHSVTLRVNRASIYNTTARFVLFSPATGKSWYGSLYDDLGLNKPAKRKEFINRLKEDLVLSSNNYFYLERTKYNEELYNKFKDSMDKKRTFISFRRSSNLGQLDSLITVIRNAFAHGNFILKDRTFILWNINNTDVNALIVISNEKLEKLIKLIIPKHYDDFR